MDGNPWRFTCRLPSSERVYTRFPSTVPIFTVWTGMQGILPIVSRPLTLYTQNPRPIRSFQSSGRETSLKLLGLPSASLVYMNLPSRHRAYSIHLPSRPFTFSLLYYPAPLQSLMRITSSLQSPALHLFPNAVSPGCLLISSRTQETARAAVYDI